MAFWDIFKVSRRTFFYPSAWIDVDTIRDNTRTIWDSISALFVTPTPVVEESFDAAMQRLGLTEEDVQVSEHRYYLYALIFLAFAALILLFSFYLLIGHYSFVGWLLGLATTALCLGQAFRFHFWYFQIKNRKLGCTFQEWRNGTIKKSEPS